jgi:hypothetical protein
MKWKGRGAAGRCQLRENFEKEQDKRLKKGRKRIDNGKSEKIF